MRVSAVINLILVALLATAPAMAQSRNGGPSRSGSNWMRDHLAKLPCLKDGSAEKGCGKAQGSTDNGSPGTPGRVMVETPKTGPTVTDKPKVRKPAKTIVNTASKPAGRKVAPKTDLASLPRPSARPNLAPVLVGDFVADEVLVALDSDGASPESLASRFNLVVRGERRSLLLDARLVRFGIPDGRTPEAVIAALSTAGVETAYLNSIYALQGMRVPKNYAYERIGVPGKPNGGKGVAVAVIDSATDSKHPSLKNIYAGFFDALPDYPVVDATHGTAVGGLIAGGGSLPGVAPQARIYHARAFENGKSTMDAILAAFDWAAGQKVRVVNMSFAGPQNTLMRQACAAALERGIVLVAAAGNNGPGAKPAYPGAYAGVIAVTATNDKDALMPQANRGDYVFVAAPGVDVIAPAPGGGADFVTGTSFAAAIVSGAVADLIAADPRRDDRWIEQALAETAHDLGANGRDDDFGYGLLSVGAAAKLAAN